MARKNSKRKAAKPALTKDEIRTINAARKLLVKLTYKHSKLEDNEAKAAFEAEWEVAMLKKQNFEDELACHDIDFDCEGNAFISYT